MLKKIIWVLAAFAAFLVLRQTPALAQHKENSYLSLPDKSQFEVMVVRAETAGSKPVPGILFLHNPGNQFRNDAPWLETIALQGWIAYSIGYSKNDKTAFYEIQKVLETMKVNPLVDTSRIAVVGFGKGADLAFPACAGDSGIRALVDVSGSPLPESEASALSGFSGNILIIHGGRNTKIPLKDIQAFYDRLRSRGKRVNLSIIPEMADVSGSIDRMLVENIYIRYLGDLFK